MICCQCLYRYINIGICVLVVNIVTISVMENVLDLVNVYVLSYINMVEGKSKRLLPIV